MKDARPFLDIVCGREHVILRSDLRQSAGIHSPLHNRHPLHPVLKPTQDMNRA